MVLPSTVACFFDRLYQGPVASVFWLDDALESALRLDGIVTLVDAKNIQRQLQRVSDEDRGGGDVDVAQPGERPRNEAAMQIAYADRVLVNKVCACVGCCRLRVAVTFELRVSPLNTEWQSGIRDSTLCDQSRGVEPHDTNHSMSARNYMTREARGYSGITARRYMSDVANSRKPRFPPKEGTLVGIEPIFEAFRMSTCHHLKPLLKRLKWMPSAP